MEILMTEILITPAKALRPAGGSSESSPQSRDEPH